MTDLWLLFLCFRILNVLAWIERFSSWWASSNSLECKPPASYLLLPLLSLWAFLESAQVLKKSMLHCWLGLYIIISGITEEHPSLFWPGEDSNCCHSVRLSKDVNGQVVHQRVKEFQCFQCMLYERKHEANPNTFDFSFLHCKPFFLKSFAMSVLYFISATASVWCKHVSSSHQKTGPSVHKTSQMNTLIETAVIGENVMHSKALTVSTAPHD